MSWIKTFTGREFDIIAISKDDLEIMDIATALSRLCRWGGHTRVFYSVAEHSVRVSEKLPGPLQLAGLLHDASEAYVQDLIGPLKNQDFMHGYRAFEDLVHACVEDKFGVTLNHELVTQMDRQMGEAERTALMTQTGPGTHFPLGWGWGPEYAKGMFLRRFNELTKGSLWPL